MNLETEILVGHAHNFKRAANAPNGLRSVTKAQGKTSDRVIVGIASVFGNIDLGGDIVTAGAMFGAIEEFKAGRSQCRFVWNHNHNDPPVAEILDMKVLSALELPSQVREVDGVTGGLQITRRYFTDPFSDRVYQGVASGAISEMSFAFNTDDSKNEIVSGKHVNGHEIRIIKNLKLLDCADVNWGMNPATMATAKGPRVINAASKQADKNRVDILAAAGKMIAEHNGARRVELDYQASQMKLIKLNQQLRTLRSYRS